MEIVLGRWEALSFCTKIRAGVDRRDFLHSGALHTLIESQFSPFAEYIRALKDTNYFISYLLG